MTTRTYWQAYYYGGKHAPCWRAFSEPDPCRARIIASCKDGYSKRDRWILVPIELPDLEEPEPGDGWRAWPPGDDVPFVLVQPDTPGVPPFVSKIDVGWPENAPWGDYLWCCVPAPRITPPAPTGGYEDVTEEVQG